MHRSIFLPRMTSQVLSITGGKYMQRISRLHCCTQPHLPTQQRLTVHMRHNLHNPLLPQVTVLAKYSDLSSQKYTLIYSLPHIKILRAVSRLKLIQTGITLVILPPVFYLYLQGDVSYFLVSYSTGIALFAGAMLYAASHFLRGVVGMMYVDPTHTTLKVAHLTFWGKRNDIYMPVSDVMTIADTGDSRGESILKLKRYSTPHVMYFSTRFGRVVDKQSFEKVFGSLQ